MHFHPFVAAFLIPFAIVVSLAALPFINLKEEPSGFGFTQIKQKKLQSFLQLQLR